MSRISTIKQLDPKIRQEIATLRERGITIDQILAKLRELGEEHVSRSALGRYLKEIDQVGEKIRRSREISEALVRELGKGPESRSAQLNIELMHTVIMDLLMGGEDGKSVILDPKNAMFLAGALKDITAARKSDADLILQIRRETIAMANAAVDRVAKTGGLSAATVAALKQEFLGIARK